MKTYLVWAQKGRQRIYKEVSSEVDLYNLVNDTLAYKDFDELVIRTTKYEEKMKKSGRIGG